MRVFSLKDARMTKGIAEKVRVLPERLIGLRHIEARSATNQCLFQAARVFF